MLNVKTRTAAVVKVLNGRIHIENATLATNVQINTTTATQPRNTTPLMEAVVIVEEVKDPSITITTNIEEAKIIEHIGAKAPTDRTNTKIAILSKDIHLLREEEVDMEELIMNQAQDIRAIGRLITKHPMTHII